MNHGIGSRLQLETPVAECESIVSRVLLPSIYQYISLSFA